MSATNEVKLLEIASNLASFADDLARIRSMIADIAEDVSDDAAAKLTQPMMKITDASMLLIGANLDVRATVAKMLVTLQPPPRGLRKLKEAK